MKWLTTRRWSRRGRTALVLTTVFAGLFLAGTGIAQASILQFQDGFEVSPASVWHISVGGDGNAGFEIGKGTARSGANNGWIFASNGWASEGIWVPTAAAVHQDAQCIEQMWVESVGVATVRVKIFEAGWSGIH
jgi:hypothetical protein